MAEKKILIAEDDAPLRRAFELKFKNLGYNVELAENGSECVDKFKKGKFDVVLTDLIMPEMNGFEVLEAIKKINDKVSVIVVSNLSQPEDEEKAKKLGAEAFFIKSNVPIAEIVKHVENLIK